MGSNDICIQQRKKTAAAMANTKLGVYYQRSVINLADLKKPKAFRPDCQAFPSSPCTQARADQPTTCIGECSGRSQTNKRNRIYADNCLFSKNSMFYIVTPPFPPSLPRSTGACRRMCCRPPPCQSARCLTAISHRSHFTSATRHGSRELRPGSARLIDVREGGHTITASLWARARPS